MLGQPWLQEHKAVVSYADNCVKFWRGGRRVELNRLVNQDTNYYMGVLLV